MLYEEDPIILGCCGSIGNGYFSSARRLADRMQCGFICGAMTRVIRVFAGFLAAAMGPVINRLTQLIRIDLHLHYDGFTRLDGGYEQLYVIAGRLSEDDCTLTVATRIDAHQRLPSFPEPCTDYGGKVEIGTGSGEVLIFEKGHLESL